MRNKTIPSKVLEEAGKLCALSDDPAASTYEIEQALKKAHDLLTPYGLTVEEVLESLHRDVVEERYQISGRKRRAKWLDDLMRHVSSFCDCRMLFRTGYVVEYIYIGLTSQVQRAMFHAGTLHEQVDYYGEVRAPRNTRDIRVYKQGVVDRVAETMRDLRSQKERLTAGFVSSIVDSIQSGPEGSRVLILAQVSPDRASIFTQARIDGKIVRLDRIPDLPPDDTVEVVVDQFRMRRGVEQRITDDVRDSFYWADDVVVENLDTAERNVFTLRKKDPPPRLPAPIMSKLQNLINGHVDQINPSLRPPLHGQWSANQFNPDYAIGYHHGADIKIRAGLR